MYTCYIQSFKILASFCGWAGWFESYLVKIPKDTFSRDVPLMVKKQSVICKVISVVGARSGWHQCQCSFLSVMYLVISDQTTMDTSLGSGKQVIRFFAYRKNPQKKSDTRKICCNHPKIWTRWLCCRVLHPEDADGIANSEDPIRLLSVLGLHCLPRLICPKTLDHNGIG